MIDHDVTAAPHLSDCPMSTPLYVERGYDVFGRKTNCWCGALRKMEKPRLEATLGLPIPDEPEGYPAITATKRFDPSSRFTWLEFSAKPCEDLRKNLRDLGWHFGGFRKQHWTNRRHPILPDAAHFNITYEDDGECDYSSERPDRLEGSAKRHSAEAHSRFEAAHKIGSMIPLGQPILVGHHSEKRHRRDIDKIDRNMRKGSEEFKTAQRLEERAESSRRHQARKQSAPAMHRRKQRLEADLRSMERTIARYPTAAGGDVEYLGRKMQLEREIADLTQKIADAGGIPADSLNASKGDIVKINGARGRVVRVNSKSYTVDLLDLPPLYGGKLWQQKYDKSELQAVIERASESNTPAI